MTDERASQNIALQFESKDGQILFTMRSVDLDVTLTTTLRHVQRLGAALQTVLPAFLPMLAQTFQRGFTAGAQAAQEDAAPGTSTEIAAIAAIAVASTAQLEPTNVAKLLAQVVESSGVLKVHYHDGRVRLVGLPEDFEEQLIAMLEPALEAEVWVELLTQEDLDAMKYHGEFCFYVDQLCASTPAPTDEQ